MLEKKIQIFNQTLNGISRELKIDILTDLTKSKVSSEIIEDDTNISHEEWLAYLIYMEILSFFFNFFIILNL